MSKHKAPVVRFTSEPALWYRAADLPEGRDVRVWPDHRDAVRMTGLPAWRLRLREWRLFTLRPLVRRVFRRQRPSPWRIDSWPDASGPGDA